MHDVRIEAQRPLLPLPLCIGCLAAGGLSCSCDAWPRFNRKSVVCSALVAILLKKAGSWIGQVKSLSLSLHPSSPYVKAFLPFALKMLEICGGKNVDL